MRPHVLGYLALASMLAACGPKPLPAAIAVNEVGQAFRVAQGGLFQTLQDAAVQSYRLRPK
jgi:hypothetical protein